ncbi:MAG TPA: uroporphyrinogen-III synthase [Rhodanobacteraceae bacterium]|nr:uroporphyrinogen-III synthase [Rhodanobacteraceae bacterium]
MAITRPVGTGTAMARRVRDLGGIAFSLPGSSLRAVGNPELARATLREALRGDCLVFTSPAAVRFAATLLPLRTCARVIAPGAGTAAALKHAGLKEVAIPGRTDSEGVLALPELQRVRGLTLGVIGAPGGRELLQQELAARGARITVAHVYERVAARLDRRRFEPLLRNRSALYVPLSSVETLRHLLKALPMAPRRKLLAGTAIASSARLQCAAKDAGFARVLRAASAHDHDLIAAIVAAHRQR